MIIQTNQHTIGQQTRALDCAVTKTHADPGLKTFADSTVCEYILRIHGGS